jgi:hypothetical protein
MKSITRAAGALALTGFLASGAFAAETGPLAAGKPAGVKQAALEDRSPLIWLGVAAVIAVTIAIVASDNDNGVTTPTTNTSGAP